MAKILIRLYVPVLQEQQDLFAPGDLALSELTALIADGIADLSDGKYRSSGNEMLMLREPEMLLDPRKTLRDYSVRDGAEIMIL